MPFLSNCSGTRAVERVGAKSKASKAASGLRQKDRHLSRRSELSTEQLIARGDGAKQKATVAVSHSGPALYSLCAVLQCCICASTSYTATRRRQEQRKKHVVVVSRVSSDPRARTTPCSCGCGVLSGQTKEATEGAERGRTGRLRPANRRNEIQHIFVAWNAEGIPHNCDQSEGLGFGFRLTSCPISCFRILNFGKQEKVR